MGLRKDDPVYYKSKLNDLIKKAVSNGLAIKCQHLKDGVGVYFVASNGDVAGVNLIENSKEVK